MVQTNLVSYGKHLTNAEADALVAPHPDSREAVRSWIGYHSINADDVTHHFAGGEWIILRVTVAQAERMLNAKYNIYYNPASSERVVRTMDYSLPRILHSHVDLVMPTTYFSTIRGMRATHFVQSVASDVQDSIQGESISTTTPASSCNSTITPSCLRTLYNTLNYTVTSSSTNKLGVVGYLQEYANRVDLQVGFSVLVTVLIFIYSISQTFFAAYRTDATGSRYTTVLVNGGQDDQTKPGVEACSHDSL